MPCAVFVAAAALIPLGAGRSVPKTGARVLFSGREAPSVASGREASGTEKSLVGAIKGRGREWIGASERFLSAAAGRAGRTKSY